jgi:hypothetical protein
MLRIPFQIFWTHVPQMLGPMSHSSTPTFAYTWPHFSAIIFYFVPKSINPFDYYLVILMHNLLHDCVVFISSCALQLPNFVANFVLNLSPTSWWTANKNRPRLSPLSWKLVTNYATQSSINLQKIPRFCIVFDGYFSDFVTRARRMSERILQ